MYIQVVFDVCLPQINENIAAFVHKGGGAGRGFTSSKNRCSKRRAYDVSHPPEAMELLAEHGRIAPKSPADIPECTLVSLHRFMSFGVGYEKKSQPECDTTNKTEWMDSVCITLSRSGNVSITYHVIKVQSNLASIMFASDGLFKVAIY